MAYFMYEGMKETAFVSIQETGLSRSPCRARLLDAGCLRL